MRITHIKSLKNESGMCHPASEAQTTWQSLKSSRYAITKADAYRETLDELFNPYAWSGGYPIIFVIADDCTILCANCAKEAFTKEHIDINCDIYYEGPTEYCEECNVEIESAYGDPNEETEAQYE